MRANLSIRNSVCFRQANVMKVCTSFKIRLLHEACLMEVNDDIRKHSIQIAKIEIGNAEILTLSVGPVRLQMRFTCLLPKNSSISRSSILYNMKHPKYA